MNEWGDWQGRMRMDTDTILVMLERACRCPRWKSRLCRSENDTALTLRKTYKPNLLF